MQLTNIAAYQSQEKVFNSFKMASKTFSVIWNSEEAQQPLKYSKSSIYNSSPPTHTSQYLTSNSCYSVQLVCIDILENPQALLNRNWSTHVGRTGGKTQLRSLVSLSASEMASSSFVNSLMRCCPFSNNPADYQAFSFCLTYLWLIYVS